QAHALEREALRHREKSRHGRAVSGLHMQGRKYGARLDSGTAQGLGKVIAIEAGHFGIYLDRVQPVNISGPRRGTRRANAVKTRQALVVARNHAFALGQEGLDALHLGKSKRRLKIGHPIVEASFEMPVTTLLA